MNISNKVISSGIWYTISNFVLKGVVFISIPIFSRIMSKEQFGSYSNYNTWLQLLITIVSFNLYVSVNRARLDFWKNLDEYCSSILLLGTGITLLFYIVVYFNINTFKQLFSMDEFYIHTMFLYLLVQPALEIFQVKQRVLYEYKASVLLSFISTLVTTIPSILLVLLLEDKFKARVIGYIFPFIVLNIFIYVYLLFKGKSFNFRYCKYAVLYSWPFIPHLLATYILSASDRIMITKFCGNQYTALYTIASNCMGICTLFLSALNNAVSPWIFDKIENEDIKIINDITAPYCFIFFFITQLAMLLAPELLWILGGTQYSGSKSMVVPLLTSVILQFAYCLYVNVEQYSRKTWAIALGTTIAAIINVLLNYILLPKYGYWIASYTTLAGYVVLFFVHYIFVRIIGYKNLYNDKFVFLMIFAAGLEQPVISFLYEHTFIRFIILTMGFFTAVLIIMRKVNILSGIKKFDIN